MYVFTLGNNIVTADVTLYNMKKLSLLLFLFLLFLSFFFFFFLFCTQEVWKTCTYYTVIVYQRLITLHTMLGYVTCVRRSARDYPRTCVLHWLSGRCYGSPEPLYQHVYKTSIVRLLLHVVFSGSYINRWSRLYIHLASVVSIMAFLL